jgi:spore coat protein A
MSTRRTFLRNSSIALAAALSLRKAAWPFAQTPRGIRKFIVPLQGLGPTGIPVASPDTTSFPGEDSYHIRVGEYTQHMHPDLPGPTKFWGYADITNGQEPNHRYLGGAIVAQKGRPVRLKATNNLPPVHPLPVDATLAESDLAQNRCCVHLHGGHTPWTSDGGPMSWFSPTEHGETFLNGTGVPGEALYRYPNEQSARLAWYHDHAMGITRLNAYAGIASAYIIRDQEELELIDKHLIPALEVPLIIQDKTFVSELEVDKGYTWGKPGDLWYPTTYEWQGQEGRWDYGPEEGQVISDSSKRTLPQPSCVPEFFSDTPVINGTLYPYLAVEPRHDRFRILNGSQARFYNLQLYFEHPSIVGEADLHKAGPRMLQIGTEGGFLPIPVLLNNPPRPFHADVDSDGNPIPSTMTYTLLLAPAERADVIIDFSDVPVGSRLILYNDAPAPFPMGDIRNDYFTRDHDQIDSGGAPSTAPGMGANTRTLMQFRIVPRVGPPDPASLDWMERFAIDRNVAMNHVVPAVSARERARGGHVRDLTLNEGFDDYGRLIQMLGTSQATGTDVDGNLFFGRAYLDPVTEKIPNGSTEIWRIFNLTGDTHPMHFHLVNAEVISRQPFDTLSYGQGAPRFTAPSRPPDWNELGMKETIRMNPGECTTLVITFNLPTVPYHVPDSPRTGGAEYVWHCHILEHEEHDMMRPLVIV